MALSTALDCTAIIFICKIYRHNLAHLCPHRTCFEILMAAVYRFISRAVFCFFRRIFARGQTPKGTGQKAKSLPCTELVSVIPACWECEALTMSTSRAENSSCWTVTHDKYLAGLIAYPNKISGLIPCFRSVSSRSATISSKSAALLRPWVFASASNAAEQSALTLMFCCRFRFTSAVGSAACSVTGRDLRFNNDNMTPLLTVFFDISRFHIVEAAPPCFFWFLRRPGF